MCTQNHVHTHECGPSRRGFLTTVSGGLIGTAAAELLPAARAQEKPGPADLGPMDALDLLYAGNKRFAAGKPEAPHRDLDRLKEVAPAQKPFAAFLGCADSRVPIEIVFDQGFGDLFVTRIAGNVSTPEITGSLEFGTVVLGAKVLFVLGHTNCGAVTAAVKADEVPGQISSLFYHIRPAVRGAKGDVAAAVRENVRNQMDVLREASPVIARLVKRGQLVVGGGVYDLATGKVEPVNG
ncbi:carbonic anhydrase [Frigoriglobus tundricola]|uniref:carbonic anhydrase n=1 Tax=Frigoriglobus tundricola TaxID=2774151 RepID=A0A6M5YQY1_9BACT|nr:carbonic anhydrase [Frigoriglobus tundricola]QJW96358.1 Carbonic anhydrase, beta class [Frigoriglobus tundricola]